MSEPNQAEFEAELALRASALAREGVEALEPMYDLVAGRLLGYARLLTKTQNEAEDVLQASFLKLARFPRKLTRAEYPWPYLLRLVRNEAISQLYRRKPLELSSMPIQASPRGGSLDEFDAWERNEVVRLALQELPAFQAEVISLKIWEGLTFREIAVVTDATLSAVTSRYRYGLVKLAALLRAFADPERSVVMRKCNSASRRTWNSCCSAGGEGEAEHG